MNHRALLFAAFLSILVTFSFAGIHRVSYNVPTVISLSDGDEIVLADVPYGWGYTKVVLGINSIPSLPLQGRLVVNGCEHELFDYYTQIDFPYDGDNSIVYHGPSQKLPLQWWLDAGPVVSKCNAIGELSRRDSVLAAFERYVDTLYAKKIRDYIDLGELNTVNKFRGSSARFKIEKLPDWFYNVIYVQVESEDGRELDGYVYAGGKRKKLSGWSSMFALSHRNGFAPFFELAFSEYRKLGIKWWAAAEQPKEEPIEKTERSLEDGKVEVTYSFGSTSSRGKSVKLTFDRSIFKDGKVPVVKKLSFRPTVPMPGGRLDIYGDVYDYSATLNPGDSAVLAIPVDFGYRDDMDSLKVLHFIEEENRWIEEKVDSIVGGYAYFKVGHFSRFLPWWVPGAIVAPIPTFVCAAFDDCRETAEDIVEGAVDIFEKGVGSIANGVSWTFGFLEDLVCLDIDELKKIFVDSDDPKWEIDQGALHYESLVGKDGKNAGIIDVLSAQRNQSLVKMADVKPSDACGGTAESCRWEQTRKNLDILLADAIISKMPTEFASKAPGAGIAKFSYSENDDKVTITDANGSTYLFTDYFAVKSNFIDKAAATLEWMEQCYNVVNISGTVVQKYKNLYNAVKKGSYTDACHKYIDIYTMEYDYAQDVKNCAVNVFESDMGIFENHQNNLINVSEAMVRVSLLAWLNKTDFRNYSLMFYKSVYDGVLAWLELAGPFLDYNNIVIKAYGSLALYEYIHYGSGDNLAKVNGALGHHYDVNGGYSEGTGYSQYIWDDLTYVLAAMKDAYTSKKQEEKFNVNENFMKSPDYMFDFSRPVGKGGTSYGLIPVEADDGVTYNPDYRVWAKLTGDARYLAMAETYPQKVVDGKVNVLTAFGYPDTNMYNSTKKKLPNRGNLWSSFKDGIGMITAVRKLKDGSKDTVSLSMIAEGGDMWTNGQAHDQQDNQSITLASSKDGFIIQDRGYSGFGVRSGDDNFHRYNAHNVLTCNFGDGQPDNRTVGIADLWSRIYDFTGTFPGVLVSTLTAIVDVAMKVMDKDYNFTVEGGYTASLSRQIVNDAHNEVVGYTATTFIDSLSLHNLIINKRSILYFGGSFWVIDRPSTKGMKWLANSPEADWKNLKARGLSVYGSEKGILQGGKGNELPIVQNGSRADFVQQDGKVLLPNYSYSLYDENALTYVMTYPVNDEGFERTTTKCPANHQCFVNAAADKRLVVPPQGVSFNLCNAIPSGECYGEMKSSGITMMKKSSGDSWEISWVLDGVLTGEEDGVEVECVAAQVSRTSYAMIKKDGTVVTGNHKTKYLPAIPLLLLR